MGSREHLTICAYVVFVLCMCVFSPGGLCQMNVCKSIVAFCQLFINCIFVSQQEISVGLRWLGSTKLYHTSSWGVLIVVWKSKLYLVSSNVCYSLDKKLQLLCLQML